MIVKFPQAGQYGVNRDLSQHELPLNVWTDSRNVRFLDGLANQFYGHTEVFATPAFAPQHCLPVYIAGAKYWIYATSAKQYAVTAPAGVVTHTDISHVTARTGVVNNWTSTLLSGIPVMNAGDVLTPPMFWDLNLANKFVNLTAWPANTYCKSIRAYKNYLVALNITKVAVNYPFMVKWSSAAVPGAVPSSWDQTDATVDAGEVDIAEGSDPIVDGLQLRDSFMIYKENSVWRMDLTSGAAVFKFSKVLGTSGILNRNCIVELDGVHLVMSQSDVYVHDGQTATSVMDKQTRRDLFRTIEPAALSKCFVFKNTFFNEAYVCYPSPGATSCDRAMVWNYVDKTVSFRDMPNLNHAAVGAIDTDMASTWASDSGSWESDVTTWDGADNVPGGTRVIMASANTKFFLLDQSAAYDGSLPAAYMERRGLSFGEPEKRHLITSIRPRITGTPGSTVLIKVGYSDDPYADPTYTTTMTHTIGTTVSNDCTVSGRYIAIRFETGTSYQWRLDTFDAEVQPAGMW